MSFLPPAGWERWRDQIGEPGCFTFVGEPGAGKSTCLAAAANLLAERGEACVSFTPSASAPPYGLMEQIWRWASLQAPVACAAIPRPLQSLMASLWPWSFPQVSPFDEPGRLARVMPELLRRLLAEAAGGRRLHLLIDDWERVDLLSRDMLLDALQGPFSPLHVLLAAGEPVAEATPFRLEPFDLPRTERWLADVLADTPGPGLAERLWRVAGGNPGWMKEALSLMQASDADGDTLLGSVDSMIAATWNALNAGSKTIVALLALHGGHCSQDDWNRCEALLASDWPLDWEVLLRRRVVSEGEGQRRLALVWWVDWVLAHDAPAHLRHLAAEVARTWASVDAPPSMAFTIRIARMALRGDDHRLALVWAHRAAEAVARVGDFRSTLQLAQDGLAVVALHEPRALSSAEALALRFLEADAWRVMGRLDEAVGTYQDLLARETEPVQRARLLVSLGKCHQMGTQLGNAVEAFQAAVQALEGGPETEERARAQAALGRAQFMLGDREASRRAYQACLVEARRTGDLSREGGALAFLGKLAAEEPATLAEGLNLLEHALQLREQSGDVVGRIDSLQLLGHAHLMHGQAHEARQPLLQALELAREVTYHLEAALTCLNLALCDVEQGHWLGARQWLQAAREELATAQRSTYSGPLAFISSLVEAHLGDHYAGALEAAARELQTTANPYMKRFGHLYEASRNLYLGQFAAARQAAEEVVAGLERVGGGEERWKAWAVLAEARLLGGDRPAAELALSELQAVASDFGSFPVQAQLMRIEGLFAWGRGEQLQARRLWEEALPLARAADLSGLVIDLTLLLLLPGEPPPEGLDLGRLAEQAEAQGARAEQALLCLAGTRLPGQDPAAIEAAAEQGRLALRAFLAQLPSSALRASFLGHPLRRPLCELGSKDVALRQSQRPRQGEWLRSLAAQLLASERADDVWKHLHDGARDLVAAERLQILLPLPTGAWQRAMPDQDWPTAEAAMTWAQERQGPLVCEFSPEGAIPGQLVVLAVRGAASCHGQLALWRGGPDAAWSQEDLRGLKMLVAQAALALDTLQLDG
ncbi:MAG: AAA family ATPase [Candidatus Sericytochromatia bacterium]|nr:AAA family ATPase [Candidatus Sericytochromatia bacterium]